MHATPISQLHACGEISRNACNQLEEDAIMAGRSAPHCGEANHVHSGYYAKSMSRLYTRAEGGKGYQAVGWVCRDRHVRWDPKPTGEDEKPAASAR